MMSTSIKQFCVGLRSSWPAARGRPVQSIVVVSAALTLFLASRGRARADFITITGQPTFQTVESASDVEIVNNVVQPALTQTFTNAAAGATTNSFNMLNINGSATASVDTGYNSSPSSLTDYVLLSTSVSANSSEGPAPGLYQYLDTDAESYANVQGATFTLNQAASAVLTFAPTLSIGS